MFTISNGEGLSLNQLHDFQKKEGDIVRSSHIGNLNNTTLFLAQEGFPIILHEHLLGCARMYKPGLLKSGQGEVAIAENLDLPATHLSFPSNIPEQVVYCENRLRREMHSPAQLHYYTLKELFPNNVFLASDWLLSQKDYLTKTLEVLQENYSHLFKNFVTEEGKILDFSKELGNELILYSNGETNLTVPKNKLTEVTMNYLVGTSDVIKNNGAKPEGVVMGTNLYIFLTAMSELYKTIGKDGKIDSDKFEILHFSGGEMINYLIKNAAFAQVNGTELNDMFLLLRQKLGSIIPKEIEFKMIPTEESMGKVISTSSYRNKLTQSLFKANELLSGRYSERGQISSYISRNIADEIKKLNCDEFDSKIEYYKANYKQLPGSLKREILEVGLLNKEKSVDLLIRIEVAINNKLFDNKDYNLVQQEISDGKKEIKNLNTQMVQEGVENLSQYDLLLDNKKVFFPEAAYELSQAEIKKQWNYSSKEYRKEIEITSETCSGQFINKERI